MGVTGTARPSGRIPIRFADRTDSVAPYEDQTRTGLAGSGCREFNAARVPRVAASCF